MDRFRTLGIFLRVCEARSFTQAASSLNLPRSTVTQAVQRLEAQLKTQLLVRTTRQVSLTPEGETFVDKARQLLADWDELEGLFLPNKAPSGVLRINLPTRLARLVVIPHLADFHQRYPKIALQLTIADQPIDPVKEGVDAVLRAGPLKDSNLRARNLGQMPQATLASPGYLARFGTPLDLDQLAGHRMVAYALPSSGRIEPLDFTLAGQCQTRMLPFDLSTNGADAYVAAGLAGFGLIQGPRYDLEEQVAKGLLVEVLPKTPPPPMALALLYPANRHPSQRLRCFSDWLARLVAELGITESGV
ncbi:LysR family transcriptional regulator [Gallaecimonas xiamenensis]|uniref:LysR family transcriptional regulator n=1 Tax=Gallaecimonas xiamenensis 3-C-1 TaxID=745411 RepID=K2JGU9_9GAMM|nr:LysR family transcriptional regulator [Gallaecimonas xiamenensis]EKE69879.1 LysR family transcriptional regulator [Gallaecimonas xiamenensis 3-C-1]